MKISTKCSSNSCIFILHFKTISFKIYDAMHCSLLRFHISTEHNLQQECGSMSSGSGISVCLMQILKSCQQIKKITEKYVIVCHYSSLNSESFWMLFLLYCKPSCMHAKFRSSKTFFGIRIRNRQVKASVSDTEEGGFHFKLCPPSPLES